MQISSLKKLLLALGLTLSLSALTAFAGAACNDKELRPSDAQKAFKLALKTREALEKTGAELAIVARVGQDLSKYGLHYSHAGIIWRDHPQGKWIVSHELNQCGTANSALFNEGLANFFFDDMFAWDTQIIVPSPALQASIVSRLKNPQQLLALHEPHYSVVAYPFSVKYQNSNQWVLELIADAKLDSATPSRELSQAWLKTQHFQPTQLHIPALTRLGGRMFKANVAFDDHPNQLRYSGKINVVSVEALVNFIQKIDIETKLLQLTL